MARVRQKFIKTAARAIVANYYEYILEIWDKTEELAKVDPALAGQLRFDALKKLVDIVAITPSKRVRNRIAGYIVRIMRQILELGRISIDELRRKYKFVGVIGRTRGTEPQVIPAEEGGEEGEAEEGEAAEGAEQVGEETETEDQEQA